MESRPGWLAAEPKAMVCDLCKQYRLSQSPVSESPASGCESLPPVALPKDALPFGSLKSCVRTQLELFSHSLMIDLSLLSLKF